MEFGVESTNELELIFEYDEVSELFKLWTNLIVV